MAAGFMKTALTLLCVMQKERKSRALFVLLIFGAFCFVYPTLFFIGFVQQLNGRNLKNMI